MVAPSIPGSGAGGIGVVVGTGVAVASGVGSGVGGIGVAVGTGVGGTAVDKGVAVGSGTGGVNAGVWIGGVAGSSVVPSCTSPVLQVASRRIIPATSAATFTVLLPATAPMLIAGSLRLGKG